VVEAELSGVSSGTEMFLYRGTYPNFKLKKWAQWQDYPVRPGYELVGRMVQVGPPARGGDAGASMASLQPGAGVIVANSHEFQVGVEDHVKRVYQLPPFSTRDLSESGCDGRQQRI
jgi:hypothetical protein